MQFHLIVVSIFLKTCVKDHGDSSSRFSLLSVNKFKRFLLNVLIKHMVIKTLHRILLCYGCTQGTQDC